MGLMPLTPRVTSRHARSTPSLAHPLSLQTYITSLPSPSPPPTSIAHSLHSLGVGCERRGQVNARLGANVLTDNGPWVASQPDSGQEESLHFGMRVGMGGGERGVMYVVYILYVLWSCEYLSCPLCFCFVFRHGLFFYPCFIFIIIIIRFESLYAVLTPSPHPHPRNML